MLNKYRRIDMLKKRYTKPLQVNNFRRVLMLVLCDTAVIVLAAWLAHVLRLNSLRTNPIEFYRGKYKELIVLCLIFRVGAFGELCYLLAIRGVS